MDTYCIYGARIGLALPDNTTARALQLLHALQPIATTDEPDARYVVAGDARRSGIVRHDNSRFAAPTPVGVTAEQLVDDLHLTVALHARDSVFVHAGVVALDGRAILLPGRSFAGKSTLTVALVRAGAAYLSDEYAVLSADGTVAPYPRNLSLRTPSGRIEIDPGPGALSLDQRLPVDLVVATRYAPDASFAPVALPAASTALLLVDNTVVAQHAPAAALRASAAVARDAFGVQSPRGDADAAAIRIIGLARQLAQAPAAA